METYESCYRFEKITYTDGLFNKSIDATYIIHLEGNGRLDNINKQLSEYHITNTVYILFNKGFKKCKKELKLQRSDYDLIDANITIFKHSNLEKYSNILVLEDDFIFMPEVKETSNINNINSFLNKNINNDFMYCIGILPFITIPYDLNNNYVLGTGTHACIFSKRFRYRIIKNAYNIDDWDIYHIKYSLINFNKITYKEILCYQPVTQTENSKNWNISPIISNTFINIFKLDTNPKDGTLDLYKISKILSLILFIFVLFIIYRIILFFNENKYFKYSSIKYKVKK